MHIGFVDGVRGCDSCMSNMNETCLFFEWTREVRARMSESCMFPLKVALPGPYCLNVWCSVCVAVCVAGCVNDLWLPLHTYVYVEGDAARAVSPECELQRVCCSVRCRMCFAVCVLQCVCCSVC